VKEKDTKELEKTTENPVKESHIKSRKKKEQTENDANDDEQFDDVYYVNENAFRYWQTDAAKIIRAVNNIAGEFEGLNLVPFSKEAFLSLIEKREAFLMALFEMEFDKQNISPFMREIARKEAKNLSEKVIDGLFNLEKVLENIRYSHSALRYDNNAFMRLDHLHFSEGKAIITPEYESEIKDKYFTYRFESWFQKNAYLRLQEAAKVVNNTLSYLKNNGMEIHNIRSVLEEDVVSGELSINPERFKDDFTYFIPTL